MSMQLMTKAVDLLLSQNGLCRVGVPRTSQEMRRNCAPPPHMNALCNTH
jgi:hypothetical protein